MRLCGTDKGVVLGPIRCCEKLAKTKTFRARDIRRPPESTKNKSIKFILSRSKILKFELYIYRIGIEISNIPYPKNLGFASFLQHLRGIASLSTV